MTTSKSKPVKLNDLHPFEYEHPFDTKALDALQGQGVDTLVRKFNEHAIERFITIQYTGSNIKVTPANYPKIYELLEKACEIIHLPSKPSLYINWEYAVNGFTIGVENPIIVLTSGAIDLLDEKELQYLIGHEIGHIKSRHTLYHQMATFFPIVAELLGQVTLGIGAVLSKPVQWALMHWYRMSEFTADRAGLLACQDVDAAIRVMMKSSGMPTKYYNDLRFEAFVQQAKDFEELDYDNLNKYAKIVAIAESTHPWSVMRAAELLKWIDSGEYHQVLKRETRNRIKKRYDKGIAYCRNCKFRLPESSAKFCPSCGSQLEA